MTLHACDKETYNEDPHTIHNYIVFNQSQVKTVPFSIHSGRTGHLCTYIANQWYASIIISLELHLYLQ